ncbi:MAG: hypothetical protein Q9170_008227 [Blastenia crenularia]
MLSRTIMYILATLFTLLLSSTVATPTPAPLPPRRPDLAIPAPGTHDNFTLTNCYCAGGPDNHMRFINLIHVREYYNAGLNAVFRMRDTCVDDTDPRDHCLPKGDRGTSQCQMYSTQPAPHNILGTDVNQLCYHHKSEMDEIDNNNRDAEFSFNGQNRGLSGKSTGVASQEDVRAACSPLCMEVFGGYPIHQTKESPKGEWLPLYPYVHTFGNFDNIVTCDGCAAE